MESFSNVIVLICYFAYFESLVMYKNTCTPFCVKKAFNCNVCEFSAVKAIWVCCFHCYVHRDCTNSDIHVYVCDMCCTYHNIIRKLNQPLL